jgi:very-short-patch-repair endonuclease
MKIHYDSRLKDRSRQLRKAGVLSEALLWNQLKGRKIRGHQLTRQKPIDSYIVDFYCSKLSLVIEIDGISHQERTEPDLFRQRKLEGLGLSVLRFSDASVRSNIAGVVATVVDWIDRHAPITTP